MAVASLSVRGFPLIVKNSDGLGGEGMTQNSSSDSSDDAVRRGVRRLWGDRLAPVPPAAVVGRRLSPGTSSFLTEVGLPMESLVEVMFYRDERLLEPVSTGGAEFFGLAEESATVLGVKAGTDEVWSVSPRWRRPHRFVNSRFSLFILFLGLFDSRLVSLREGDEREVDAIVDDLRRNFVAYDARALDDTKNWWSLVLEQAGEGFV
jgi:hypothetical protein